jgi:hypothetical protein
MLSYVSTKAGQVKASQTNYSSLTDTLIMYLSVLFAEEIILLTKRQNCRHQCHSCCRIYSDWQFFPAKEATASKLATIFHIFQFIEMMQTQFIVIILAQILFLYGHLIKIKIKNLK